VKAAQAEEPVPFCLEKQVNDKLALQGVLPLPSKTGSPIKGQKLYYDPLNTQLHTVKINRQRLEADRLELQRAKKYQEDLDTIPLIDYHPTTELAKMKTKAKGGNEPNATAIDVTDDEKFEFEDLESKTKAAMKFARRGDTSSLYDYFMKSEINIPSSAKDSMSKHGKPRKTLSRDNTKSSKVKAQHAALAPTDENEVSTYEEKEDEKGDDDEFDGSFPGNPVDANEYEVEYDPMADYDNGHDETDNANAGGFSNEEEEYQPWLDETSDWGND